VNHHALLAVDALDVEVHRDGAWRPAVRDVSFEIARGERVALVGESGSGKSLTAMSIGRLLPAGSRLAGGRILMEGEDLLRSSAEEIRRRRGRDIGFVFQDPSGALDPTMTVGRQVAEVLRIHSIGEPRTRRGEVADLLARVGIPDARRRMDEYPHQFSGGMKQRAMIASALIAEPRLLVADEPTSALDVTIQAQIVDLLRDLSSEMGLAVLFITHDLSLARAIADRVVVMYGGRVLEDGPAPTLLHAPHHPYTRALLALAPRLGSGRRLPEPIPGAPTPGWMAGEGCPFAPRCTFAEARCSSTPWSLTRLAESSTHRSACIIPAEERQEHAPVEALS
jgi:oligopeptide/dipeptide ABC transporter ATP-binding protein